MESASSATKQEGNNNNSKPSSNNNNEIIIQNSTTSINAYSSIIPNNNNNNNHENGSTHSEYSEKQNKSHNILKNFYSLSLIHKYHQWIVNKPKLLTSLLFATNIFGGFMFGYALGTCGGAFDSIFDTFLSTGGNTGNRTIIYEGPKSFQTTISNFPQFHEISSVNIESLLSTNVINNITNNNTTSSGVDMQQVIQSGLISSVIFIGGFLGTLFGLIFNSIIGKKMSILIICLTAIISAIGGFFIQNYPGLIILRGFMGFASGLSTAAVPVYMSELMPFPKYKGFLGGMFNLGINFGITFSYIIACAFERFFDQWRVVHIFFLLPTAVLLVLGLVLPESQVFLGDEKQEGKINKVVGENTSTHELIEMKGVASVSVQSTSDAAKVETKKIEEHKETPHDISFMEVLKRLFCKKSNLIALYLACLLGISIENTGIMAATLFIPGIVAGAGVKDRINQLLCSLGIVLWQLIICAPTGLIIDKLGRKVILIFGLTLGAIMDVALGFLLQFADSSSIYKVAIAMIFIGIYVIGYNNGVGSLAYILMYEVFGEEHEKVVLLGNNIATVSLWLSAIIISFFFLPIVYASNQSVPWFMFGGISIFVLISVIFLLKETAPSKKKKQEEKKNSKATASV
ncbi:hypothetical protein ABK040_009585 [Willaertia magna]